MVLVCLFFVLVYIFILVGDPQWGPKSLFFLVLVSLVVFLVLFLYFWFIRFGWGPPHGVLNLWFVWFLVSLVLVENTPNGVMRMYLYIYISIYIYLLIIYVYVYSCHPLGTQPCIAAKTS